jgi:hypothetical protein
MPQFPSPTRSLHRRAQHGMSVVTLMVVAIVIGFFALMAIRAFPSVNEYLTIRKAVNTIMKNGPSSPADVRAAFDKQKEIEYSIQSISGKDLEITKNGDRMRTSFAYNVEIAIIEPVYLLIKYDGSATSGGS